MEGGNELQHYMGMQLYFEDKKKLFNVSWEMELSFLKLSCITCYNGSIKGV